MVSLAICNKGILQSESQVLVEGGTSSCNEQCEHMLSESNKSAFGCCGTEAVQWNRERQQKAPNEFISLFYTQSCNTKLMISVMSQNLHERSLRRFEIPKALLVKSFLKPDVSG